MMGSDRDGTLGFSTGLIADGIDGMKTAVPECWYSMGQKSTRRMSIAPKHWQNMLPHTCTLPRGSC